MISGTAHIYRNAFTSIIVSRPTIVDAAASATEGCMAETINIENLYIAQTQQIKHTHPLIVDL